MTAKAIPITIIVTKLVAKMPHSICHAKLFRQGPDLFSCSLWTLKTLHRCLVMPEWLIDLPGEICSRDWWPASTVRDSPGSGGALESERLGFAFVLGALFDSCSFFGQECGWDELRANALLELEKDACSKEPVGELGVREKYQRQA